MKVALQTRSAQCLQARVPRHRAVPCPRCRAPRQRRAVATQAASTEASTTSQGLPVFYGVTLQHAEDGKSALTCDLYLAASERAADGGKVPTAVLLGGAYGAPGEYTSVATYLAAHGWTVLVPEKLVKSPMPGASLMLKDRRSDGKVNMVGAACIVNIMRWLLQDAPSFVAQQCPEFATPDASDVYLLGHSAGAFVAALMLARLDATYNSRELQDYASDPSSVAATLPLFPGVKGALMYGFTAYQRYNGQWIPLHARDDKPTLILCGELDEAQKTQGGTVEHYKSPCAAVCFSDCDHFSIANRDYFRMNPMYKQARTCDTPSSVQHEHLFPALLVGLEALRSWTEGENEPRAVANLDTVGVLEACGDERLLRCFGSLG